MNYYTGSNSQNIRAFREFTPCRLVNCYWYLIQTCCLILRVCPGLLGSLTLRLLISYIYGAPIKARNANVVYIWTYVWQR